MIGAVIKAPLSCDAGPGGAPASAARPQRQALLVHPSAQEPAKRAGGRVFSRTLWFLEVAHSASERFRSSRGVAPPKCLRSHSRCLRILWLNPLRRSGPSPSLGLVNSGLDYPNGRKVNDMIKLKFSQVLSSL